MTFDDFWALYPKREAKKDARKAWMQLNPTAEVERQIVAALAWQVESEQWTKDDGQYIPLPATYLRGERYLDERRTGVDRRARSIEQQRATWAFQCPHTPLCLRQWDCVQLRKTG